MIAAAQESPRALEQARELGVVRVRQASRLPVLREQVWELVPGPVARQAWAPLRAGSRAFWLL